jgi:hypothetical protein
MSATARSGHDVPNLLRTAYPEHAAKRAASAAEVPPETARNWLRGRATPSASTLLRMASRCERLADALERKLHDRRIAQAGNQVPPMARPAPARSATRKGDAS